MKPVPRWEDDGRRHDPGPVWQHYRGAFLVAAPRQFAWTVFMPECPLALDGMAGGIGACRKLIDWWLDTGGDQSRLPPPYRRIGPKPTPST